VLSDDRVSAGKGDEIEWKSSERADDANVCIRIWWDEPGVAALTTLHDDRGNGLAEVEHASGARYDEIDSQGLSAGLYLIKVEATGGASVYTLEVLTEERQSGRPTGNRPGF